MNTAYCNLDTSLLSFPRRGPYGKAGYPGNTSGQVILTLLRHFMPALYCDPTEGGGTSADCVVALRREGMQIDYVGLDLATGFDLTSQRLIERLPRAADLIFVHPPYHDIVTYSASAWGTVPHAGDLSRCASYEEFLSKMFLAMQNIHEAVRRGGRYCIQIGDIRKDGTYYAIQSDLLKLAPGKLDGILIKEQHNCTSSRRQYRNRFVPIMHEYILIFERVGLVVGMLDCALDASNRLKTLANLTWRAVVERALHNLGGRAHVEDLYKAIAPSPKTACRPNWQARVRATLQECPQFENVAHGVWAFRSNRNAQASQRPMKRAS